jgi:hypothetical protein
MEKFPLLRKGLVCGIIVLFLGMSSIPITGSVPIDKEHSVMPKSCFDDFILNGTMGENNWYVSNVTVTIVDGNYTYFRIDDGNWTVYTGSFVISTDGEHIIGTTPDFEHVYNVTIKIDQTAPMLFDFFMSRAGIFKWKLLANVSDETSGINRVEFYFNDNFVNTSYTPGPYIVYWRGSMRLLQLKYLLLYHIPFSLFYFYVQPQCIVYDNAGNYVISPVVNIKLFL